MDKRSQFKESLTAALKQKDDVTTSTLRLVLAALKDKDIDARTKGNMDGISEAEILSMLQSMIKQRQESAKTYRDNARPELAAREEAEIAVIQRFLPAQLSEEEAKARIEAVIAELGVTEMRDMGKVMAEVKARYAGQLDMSKVGGIVKQKLSA